MPPLVSVGIVVALVLSARSRRDHGGCAAAVQFFEQPVGIKGLVCQQRTEMHAPDQRCNALHVMRLTGQEQEAHEVAKCIHQRHDPGCHTKLQ
jgi:hypothetical protein